MNPARIPTQVENAWAVAGARKGIAQYEAVQACSEAANDESSPDAVSETRVCIYFVIAAAFICAARYTGVLA